MAGRSELERRAVSTGNPWEDAVGYSRAVAVGGAAFDLVVVSGTTAAGPSGDIEGVGDPAAQTRRALSAIESALGELGGSLRDVVRTRLFVTDIEMWPEIGRVHGEVFADIRPAATMVEVRRLIHPDMLIEIEADAAIPRARR